MPSRFLPGVPVREIEKIFNAAPGREIATGKFDSPESSAALGANAFGYFLPRVEEMPPLPGCNQETWPQSALALEKTVHFPWRGGRHPVLNVLVVTPSELIGIESKRFEPYRKSRGRRFSDAYWRRVWGDRMNGYESVRDTIVEQRSSYVCFDAAQCVKHAFALRSQVHRDGEHNELTPILLYVYAGPKDGTPVAQEITDKHREEVERFARAVAGDEVKFVASTYRKLLADWKRFGALEVRRHVEALTRRFSL